MRNFISSKAISFVFVLFLTLSVSGQQTHTITLNVDTSKVTRTNTNSTCNFGQDPSISNADYTIEVSIGDTVEWEGISTSSENDEIDIISINHEGGARLFNRNVLNGNGGIVSGIVSVGRAGDSEKYTIKFRVYRNGRRLPGIFKIDPKLKVRER